MKEVHNIGSKIFSFAGAFILESLENIVNWLIVMFFVILCDLITGCRRAVALKEEIRFSQAWRATMGKAVTYFSFVVMVVMLNIAVGKDYHIDKWAILFVCFIEGCSIVSNLLQPKGYEFDVVEALSVLVRKVAGVEKGESIKIIKKKEETRAVKK